jgi:hypothetical protein
LGIFFERIREVAFFIIIGNLLSNNGGKIWFAKLIKGIFIIKMKITKSPKAQI